MDSSGVVVSIGMKHISCASVWSFIHSGVGGSDTTLRSLNQKAENKLDTSHNGSI